MLRHLVIASALLAATLSPLQSTAAQNHAVAANGSATGRAENQAEKPAQPAAKASTTTHRVRVGRKDLTYTATAGTLPALNDAGETEAEIFYIAYSQQSVPKKRRPLLFIFNGGPGAASVWLHLGAIGPKRVQMLPDGNMPAPPFKLIDNEHSWLDQADLVFVDPVGTGYSRAAKPDLASKFTAVRGDIESLGRFITLYLTRNERWDSPVFLVGESYGSFRTAGMSEYLVEHGVALNGMILVSSVLNMQTILFDYGNDLPYQLFLPSYTATAWYHKKLAPDLMADLDKTLQAAEEFAGGEYLYALNRGDRMSAEERRSVAEKLSRFTGLSSNMVENLNLRVDHRTFVRELLRERGQVVGFMDSRFLAANVAPSAAHAFDPTVTTIRPPFTAALNSYVREELGFKSDLEYFTLGGGIGRWDWEAKNSYADTSENLRDTLAKNPYMKVFVASGVFDLATPHFATDHTLSHLGLPASLKKNITVRRYRSGHMMYLESGSLEQLKMNFDEFMRETLKEQIK